MSSEAFRYNPEQIRFTPHNTPDFVETYNPFHPVHPAVHEATDNKSPLQFNSNNQQIITDLREIQDLKNIFDDTLELTVEERLVTRNYDPVLEFYEFNKNVKTKEELEQFKEHALQQIKTSLFERNHAEISRVEYSIGSDGKVYNSIFPKRPFEESLQKGLEYRKEQGSEDGPREHAEFAGWKQACTVLMDSTTPIGTIAIVISGPSSVKDSPYKDNFIDFYKNQKDPKTGKISITMTRFASELSFKQYFNKAKYLNPNYFYEHFDETNIPDNAVLEKTFLGNPIWMNSAHDNRSEMEIMNDHFGVRQTAMKSNDALTAWERTEAVAKYFIDEAICTNKFNPKKIATLLNALLAKNDLEVEAIKKNEKSEDKSLKPERQFKNIHEEIAWLGNQEVRSVAAACGASAGFDISGSSKLGIESPLNSILKNSVAQFGLDKDKHGSLEFECPNEKCKKINVRPYGVLLTKCQHCGSTEVACKNEKDEANVTKLPKEKKIEEKPKKSDTRLFVFPSISSPKKNEDTRPSVAAAKKRAA